MKYIGIKFVDAVPMTADVAEKKGYRVSDYKERFKAEYLQLKNRLNGLKRMLDAWDNGKLSFTPTCPRTIYNDQVRGMELYLKVLAQRATIEKVEV